MGPRVPSARSSVARGREGRLLGFLRPELKSCFRPLLPCSLFRSLGFLGLGFLLLQNGDVHKSNTYIMGLL